MRGARKLFYILISIGLATLGFATPLVGLVFGALMPDGEELIIRDAVQREVGLAPDYGTLDDAFLRDVPGPDPSAPDPGDEPVEPMETPAPPEPEPVKPPIAPPAEKKAVPSETEREGAQLPEDLPKNPVSPRTQSTGRTAAEIRAARAAAAAAAKGATKKGGGQGSKKPKCVDPTPGIAQVGENEYSVERQIILDLANDLERASKLAWTGWAYNEKGKTIGFTVKKIRCGSILDQVGLKNGDIIHEINGKNVTSITQAFGAWRKVRKKDMVRVKITRKGEKMELRYHVE